MKIKPTTRENYIKLYHPVSVEDAITYEIADMCLQGINKWQGVTRALENGAYIDGDKLIFPEDHTYFSLSGSTCAICTFSMHPQHGCDKCPLNMIEGHRCDTPKGTHTLAVKGNPVPMIDLLTVIMLEDMNS
jgi:hypothetical protein